MKDEDGDCPLPPLSFRLDPYLLTWRCFHEETAWFRTDLIGIAAGVRSCAGAGTRLAVFTVVRKADRQDAEAQLPALSAEGVWQGHGQTLASDPVPARL